MYHASDKNQHLNLKSFLNTSLSSKKLQTDVFDGDINRYKSTCTPFQIQVADLLLKYRYAPWVKLSNDTIASLIGCSHKTVTRATNKFLKDGFITKHQVNRYAPNNYTFNDKVKKGSHAFSYWMNSLSSHNQNLYFSHGIRIDHKNKIVFSIRNVPHNNISSLILDNLFINSSLSLRTRAKDKTIFKKNKGKRMDNFENQFPNMAKVKQKRRYDGGHSPAVIKPVMSIEDQIHTKKVDIAFLKQQIEKPEAFWDARSILFTANISMAKSLLARAEFQLNELQRSNNEKQSVSNQCSTFDMVQSTA